MKSKRKRRPKVPTWGWIVIGVGVAAAYTLIWAMCVVAKRADEDAERMLSDFNGH